MDLYEKIESYREKSGQAFASIIRVIKKNSEYLDELSRITSFLDSVYKDPSVQQRFYHVWFNFYEIEKCPYCESPKKFAKVPKFSIDRYGEKPTNPVNYYGTCLSIECNKKHNVERSSRAVKEKYGEGYYQSPEFLDAIKKTNNEKFGSDFFFQTDEFRIKQKETFEKKYGGHPTKLKETQDRKKSTNLLKYGTEHALNNPDVREKSNSTNTLKYGGKSSMCSEVTKEKSKRTSLVKYGTDWYVQSEEFRIKFKESMLSKYGVEHAFHYQPFFDRSQSTGFNKKLFIFPSGRVEKIQGYESFAIEDLLDSGYREEDIIISNKEISEIIGIIWYNDSENKRRRYYPDILLKVGNKIIEVKSEYTYDAGYSINIRKKQACLDMGLLFEFWIYDEKGNRRIV